MSDDITSVQQLQERYSVTRKRLLNAAKKKESAELFEKRTALVLSRIPESGGLSRVRILLSIIADVFGVPVTILLSQRRDAETVEPRQLAMAIAVEVFGISYPQAGKQFGGRDHTTVLHAHRKYKELVRKLSRKERNGMTSAELEAAGRTPSRHQNLGSLSSNGKESAQKSRKKT
jgi:chromosomal replication initiation ATPase DnaA